MSAISSMHSIVISVESMSMATTRTRSRVSPGGTNAQSMPAAAQSSATPACGPTRASRNACCASSGERVDALRGGERRDRRDVGRGDRRGLEDEVRAGVGHGFHAERGAAFRWLAIRRVAASG